ncbi:MAG: mechanosensitive ion channel [Actinomycetota bacterium]|nr:mechanosensitive ion channel [Actinomycetota bacterium]
MIVPLAGVLDRAGEALGSFLPRLGGALVLLVVGVLVARLLGRLLTRGLRGAGIDELAERWGVHDVIARIGLERSLATLIGRAIRIAATLVVVFAALSLLGLQFLSQSLNQAVLVLPKVLIAAGLLLAGVVVAGLIRSRVDRLAYQLDLPIPLGQVAQVAVLAVFAVTAAAQIAISTLVLMVVLAILLAAAAATFALAFGLGGREVARALSAGRYIRGAYRVGQSISVGDVRGEITAIDSAFTVLATGSAETVRVPNDLLLSSIVTVHEAAEPTAGGSP